MEISAHRGWSTDFPENSLPAAIGGVAAGCNEVEIDVRVSGDGVPYLLHDRTLERTHGDRRAISEVASEELERLDVLGANGGVHVGLGLVRLARFLDVVGPLVRLNIHVYESGENGEVWATLASRRTLVEACGSYLASAEEDVLRGAAAAMPWLPRCCLARQSQPEHMIATALEYACERVQFGADTLSEAHVASAHAAGLACNLFFADDVGTLERALDAGIDCVLSNAVGEALRWRRARRS